MIDFSNDAEYNQFLNERIRIGHKFVALRENKDAFLSSNRYWLSQFFYQKIYYPIRIAPYRYLGFCSLSIHDLHESQGKKSLVNI